MYYWTYLGIKKYLNFKSTRNQVLEVLYFLWQTAQKYHHRIIQTKMKIFKAVILVLALAQPGDFQGCFLSRGIFQLS